MLALLCVSLLGATGHPYQNPGLTTHLELLFHSSKLLCVLRVVFFHCQNSFTSYFICYCDFVKHKRQVLLEMRNKLTQRGYISLSLAPWRLVGGRAAIRKSLRLDMACSSRSSVWGRKKLFALSEDLSHMCMSKIIRPQALAEPVCTLPARSERLGVDDAPLLTS